MKEFMVINKKSYSRRNDRLALRIRECFSNALLKNDLYGIPCKSVTITHVDLSPDLRYAKVLVMPFGKLYETETLLFLEKNKYYFKDIIATKLNMRFVPEIAFDLDDSFEKVQRINEILERK
jgi:ribosome-binding factor A